LSVDPTIIILFSAAIAYHRGCICTDPCLCVYSRSDIGNAIFFGLGSSLISSSQAVLNKCVYKPVQSQNLDIPTNETLWTGYRHLNVLSIRFPLSCKIAQWKLSHSIPDHWVSPPHLFFITVILNQLHNYLTT